MFTFSEHKKSTLTPIEDIRNPFAEVRWGAYLRGDAYVNPLHDLVYALSRSTSPQIKNRPGTRVFEFTETAIVVSGDTDERLILPYGEMDQLKLAYAPDLYSMEATEFDSTLYNHFKATFYLGGREHEYRMNAGRQKFINLCQFLLDRRIKFREFAFGSRSFLLNTNLRYAEIQELKKKYDIEW